MKRGRGRPRKEEVTKRGRGRPRKIFTKKEKVVKRRGRPSAKQVEKPEKKEKVVIPPPPKIHILDEFVNYTVQHMRDDEKAYWQRNANKQNVDLKQLLRKNVIQFFHIEDKTI